MVFNWGVNVCRWYKAWLMMSKISVFFFSSKASKNSSVSGFFMILWIKCIRSIPIRCGLSKIHLSQVRREPLILEANIDSVTWFMTIWTNLDVITTTNREGLGRNILGWAFIGRFLDVCYPFIIITWGKMLSFLLNNHGEHFIDWGWGLNQHDLR